MDNPVIKSLKQKAIQKRLLNCMIISLDKKDGQPTVYNGQNNFIFPDDRAYSLNRLALEILEAGPKMKGDAEGLLDKEKLAKHSDAFLFFGYDQDYEPVVVPVAETDEHKDAIMGILQDYLINSIAELN